MKDLEDFLKDLIIERQYSEKTKEAYEDDITDFFSFLKESGNEDYLLVTLQDVRIYLAYLHDRKYSRNTISRKL